MTAKSEWLAEATLSAGIGTSNVRAGVAEGGRLVYLVERRIPDLLAAYDGDMVLGQMPAKSCWSRRERPWVRVELRPPSGRLAPSASVCRPSCSRAAR